MNLPVNLTDSCKQQNPCNNFTDFVMRHELQANSFELWATRYEQRDTKKQLQVTSFEWATRFKIRATSWEIKDLKLSLLRLMMVWYTVCTTVWLYCITVQTRTVSWQNQLIMRHLKVQSLSESADYQTSESTVPVRISWVSDIWKYSPCQNQLIIRHLKVQSLSESADYQTSESTVPVRISWVSDIWK